MPECSRVRPCNGFAALETKSDDFSTQNCGGCALACVRWCALLGVLWFVRIRWCALLVGVRCLVRAAWCELVGVHWSANSLVCIAALVGASWLVYAGRRAVVCIAWCGRGRGGRASGRERKLKTKTPHHDAGKKTPSSYGLRFFVVVGVCWFSSLPWCFLFPLFLGCFFKCLCWLEF